MSPLLALATTETDSTFTLHSEGLAPVGNKLLVKYSNRKEGDLIIRIHDQEGVLLREYLDSSVDPGFHQSIISLNGLESGNYSLTMILNNEHRVAEFYKESP